MSRTRCRMTVSQLSARILFWESNEPHLLRQMTMSIQIRIVVERGLVERKTEMVRAGSLLKIMSAKYVEILGITSKIVPRKEDLVFLLESISVRYVRFQDISSEIALKRTRGHPNLVGSA